MTPALETTWPARSLEGGGALRFDESWLPPPEADRLLDRLMSSLPLRQETIQIFGRPVNQPRLSAWIGDPGASYSYSGRTFAPEPWVPELIALRQRLGEALGQDFNSVLCNLYRSGQDSMGWHADNEPELGPDPRIASVSLGGTRRFVLRHRKRQAPAVELGLSHGSLLVMEGTTQHHWRHAVPKTARDVKPRLNLTFRTILGT